MQLVENVWRKQNKETNIFKAKRFRNNGKKQFCSCHYWARYIYQETLFEIRQSQLNQPNLKAIDLRLKP